MRPALKNQLLLQHHNFFREPGLRHIKPVITDDVVGRKQEVDIVPFDQRGIECGDG